MAPHSCALLAAFLERLPRDMLFVMRTWSLVRSLNRALGGTTRQRLLIIAEHAAAGVTQGESAADELFNIRPDSSSLSGFRRWQRATALAARRRWVRLRMRLVVRLIDYVGALSLGLMQALSAVRRAGARAAALVASRRLLPEAVYAQVARVAGPIEPELIGRELVPASKERLREMG